MSNRDSAYSVPNRYRRSPPDLNTHSGAFATGQSGRTVLPPLSTAFGAPYGESQHDTLASSRMSPGRNEVFSPSYSQPNYAWPSGGHTTMAGHSSYTNYAPFDLDPRYPPQPSHSPYPMRQSPGIPSGQDALRRPPMTISQTIREDTWATEPVGPSYPPSFSLSAAVPETGNFHAQSSYPMNYDSYHSAPHQGSYPALHNPTIDTRHHQHAQHPMHYPEAHTHAHSHRTPTNEWVGGNPQRIDTHLVSPYARSPRDQMSHSPQEPSPVDVPVKKKRKRADAAQLKVLNDVYARTAFPTTEERLELAKKLEMSARSVQIWFQNKRQSTRQNRTSTNTLPPMLHHTYPGGMAPQQAMPPSTPGAGPSGSGEVSVSPSSRHGIPYATHSPGHTHRTPREVSPRPPPPPHESMHRGRSPESVGRPRRPGGY